MLTLITTSLSLLIFVIYIGTTIAQFGLPWSLSGTYYLYQQKYPNWSHAGVIFSLFMVFTACSLFLSMYTISVAAGGWMVYGVILAALVLFGLLTVANFPNYLDSTIYKIHMTGAGIAAAAALVWIWFVCWEIWYVPFIAALLPILAATFTKTRKSSRDWWLEMIIFSMVYITALVESIIQLVRVTV